MDKKLTSLDKASVAAIEGVLQIATVSAVEYARTNEGQEAIANALCSAYTNVASAVKIVGLLGGAGINAASGAATTLSSWYYGEAAVEQNVVAAVEQNAVAAVELGGDAPISQDQA